MKAVMSILIILVTFNKCHSQTTPSQVRIEGVWRFVSSKRGYDPNFICTKENKIIEITYWSDTQKASLYGSPTLTMAFGMMQVVYIQKSYRIEICW
jgi:predicted type IV restriction endonuclease